MSVVKGDRSPTEEKFETGAKYKELCGYTVTTCKNETIFRSETGGCLLSLLSTWR